MQRGSTTTATSAASGAAYGGSNGRVSPGKSMVSTEVRGGLANGASAGREPQRFIHAIEDLDDVGCGSFATGTSGQREQEQDDFDYDDDDDDSNRERQRIEFDEGYYVGAVNDDGQMSGYGEAVFASGDRYEGQWHADMMDGKGTYHWEDGDEYTGEYSNGLIHGVGTMCDRSGTYTGQWEDESRQGHGKMEYATGNVYEGEWMSNMRHGKGKLIEEGGVVYEGEFVLDKKQGKGVQRSPNGDVYEGDFFANQPNGKGTYQWADGAVYIGSFRDGVKHGEGFERLASGDWVGGTFINGVHDAKQTLHKAVKMDVNPDEALDNETAMAAMKPMGAEDLRKLADGKVPVKRADPNKSLQGSFADAGKDAPSSTVKAKSTVVAGRASVSAPNGSARSSTGDATTVATPAPAAEKRLSATRATLSMSMMYQTTQLADKDLEGWRQIKMLGKGSFGAVYEALLVSGRTVCCKVIELGNLTNREELDKLRNEIALMKRLRHPNIVQYYGSQENTKTNTINIFMELVSGGSLNTFVKKFTTIPYPTVRQWTYQMVLGVKYLHDCGIVHRDIKGDNILVSHEGIVKLADFGCSKAIDDVCSKTHGCQTMVGTPYWMAPEVIKCESGGYGMKSDIWSIGCTVVEMITGKPPWPECNSMWAAVYKIANSTGLPTEIPKDLDPELRNFLEMCFERNPAKRADADTLLQHPFLQI